ncbi:hypothetical protein GTY41_03675 [Streptomyces sp. SID685]|uniref:hypothetical protein n=1 Tax=Streptomyces sp. SID685 TaxID=2690322 RepID=UPI00136DE7C4|nr:hypothetical protein [Streptomyces sp. SID685]MYR84065.1 hypothetical protein [Streptomyces sp. SID685]
MTTRTHFTATIRDTRTGATDTFVGSFNDDGGSQAKTEAQIRASFASHIEVSNIKIARHGAR